MTAGEDALPRGRHHLTREQVEASQRRRIVLAMTEEVAVRGYASTSVAHITGRAGVSRKSFYEQFTDKEDCYLAAFDTAVEILATSAIGTAQDLGIDLDPDDDPLSAFRVGLTAYVEAIANYPAAARTLLVEAYAVGPRAMKKRGASRAFLLSSLITPLGFTDEDGVPTFEAEALAATISGLITNLVAEDRIEEVPALVEPLTAWVGRQMRPPRRST